MSFIAHDPEQRQRIEGKTIKTITATGETVRITFTDDSTWILAPIMSALEVRQIDGKAFTYQEPVLLSNFHSSNPTVEKGNTHER